MFILPFLAMCFMVLEGYVYTIAVYFYAFRIAFSSILHGVLYHFSLRLAPKRVFVAVVLNKNSFHRIHRLIPFCIKTNLCENRFFAAR